MMLADLAWVSDVKDHWDRAYIKDVTIYRSTKYNLLFEEGVYVVYIGMDRAFPSPSGGADALEMQCWLIEYLKGLPDDN
jgi:hypothetical protein